MRPDRVVDRRRRRARDRRDARRLRAVPAQPRAAAGDGRALGRAHQVRGQRDARHAHLVHERARQPRRPARRRHRARAAGHRLRPAHRLPLPLSGRGLRRQLLPEGREGAAVHGARSSACRSRCSARSRRSTTRRSCVLVDKIVARLGDDLAGRTLRAVGPRVQAEHRRHARGAVARDRRRRSRARGATIVAYDPVAMDEARRVFGDAPHARATRRRRWPRCDGADALVDRHRVEGVPQPRLRRDASAAARRRSCSTAATSTTRRRCAPPGSSTSRIGRRVRPPRCTAIAPILDWRERVAARARAGRRRRDARPLLVRRRRAHLARSAGAGGQDRAHARSAPAARPTSRATPRRSARTATLLSVDRRRRGRARRSSGCSRPNGVRTSFHRDPALPTTVKLRVIGRQQQLLRIDFETAPSHEVLATKLADYERLLADADVVDPVRLRQGRPRAHRDDDRARARGGQARAGRSQGRRLGALPRRDAASRPIAASSAQVVGPLARRGRADGEGAGAARASSALDALLVTRSEEGMSLFTARRRAARFRRRRARCTTSPAPATR